MIKNRMKKLLLASVCAGLLLACPVYAAENAEAIAFCVTVGMEKEVDATFDESRTISGTAQVGDVVSVYVYKENPKGVRTLKEEHELEVGASGLFSQSVSLYIGKNIIAIEDGEYYQEVSVRRYKQELKEELVSGITIPGGRYASIS